MDPASVVATACQHQDTLTHILAWAGGTMPAVSVIAWLTARFKTLPPWAQSLLQLVAGNILHAALGEPQKP